MKEKVEVQSSQYDFLKWGLVIVIVSLGVWGNHYYAEQALLYRVLALVVLAVIAIAVALQTVSGRAFAELMRESRIEIRKVVWPTRPETLQTSLVVIAMVGITVLILWGLDSFISWLISELIG